MKLLLLFVALFIVVNCVPDKKNTPRTSYVHTSVPEAPLHAVDCQFIYKTNETNEKYLDLECEPQNTIEEYHQQSDAQNYTKEAYSMSRIRVNELLIEFYEQILEIAFTCEVNDHRITCADPASEEQAQNMINILKNFQHSAEDILENDSELSELERSNLQIQLESILGIIEELDTHGLQNNLDSP